MSRWLILAGLVLVAVGLILHYAPGLLNWFGKLPGDIRMESERGKFFFPITSIVIVSIFLTVLINLFRR
jgi:hypothetical protein